jgi:hypothetical protein
MARRTTSLPEFQAYVWDQLPFQRGMVGKEAVYDAVNVAIQEWPDEQLCGCKSGDTEELKATEQLEASVRRHMRLAYGAEKFDALWVIALQLLLPIIVDQILKWWRRRKDHQGRIRIWRRKWVNDG